MLINTHFREMEVGSNGGDDPPPSAGEGSFPPSLTDPDEYDI